MKTCALILSLLLASTSFAFFGTKTPQIRVQLLDKKNQPLVGHQVGLTQAGKGFGFESNTGVGLPFFQDQITGSLIARTDRNGVATFDSFKLSGFSPQLDFAIQPAIYCDHGALMANPYRFQFVKPTGIGSSISCESIRSVHVGLEEMLQVLGAGVICKISNVTAAQVELANRFRASEAFENGSRSCR